MSFQLSRRFYISFFATIVIYFILFSGTIFVRPIQDEVQIRYSDSLKWDMTNNIHAESDSSEEYDTIDKNQAAIDWWNWNVDHKEVNKNSELETKQKSEEINDQSNLLVETNSDDHQSIEERVAVVTKVDVDHPKEEELTTFVMETSTSRTEVNMSQQSVVLKNEDHVKTEENQVEPSTRHGVQSKEAVKTSPMIASTTMLPLKVIEDQNEITNKVESSTELNVKTEENFVTSSARAATQKTEENTSQPNMSQTITDDNVTETIVEALIEVDIQSKTVSTTNVSILSTQQLERSIAVDHSFQSIGISEPHIEVLEDIDNGERPPQSNKSASQIFFLETSTPDGGFLKLGAREACAIESAAYYHPNHTIYVLVTGDTKVDHTDPSSKYYRIIRKNFKNVLFRSLDPVNFTVGSPIENFFRLGKHKNSMFYETHLADILRLVVLWKYGGLYLDLDVVVLKNFEKLGEDFLGKANEFVLLTGTMQLSGTGIGHRVADQSLRRLVSKFNGKGWGSNGPKLVTKVMAGICGGAQMAKNMHEGNCQGMKFLENKKLIPIRHFHHGLYFHEAKGGYVLRLLKKYGAFTAHLFHHLTQNIEVPKTSKCAYAQLAQKNCPNVFSSVDTNFD